MMFKKKKTIRLSYNEQGLIHFVCANYKRMPPDVKRDIDNLAELIAGEDKKALLELLKSGNDRVSAVARKHFMSEKRLYSHKVRFFENFFRFMG